MSDESPKSTTDIVLPLGPAENGELVAARVSPGQISIGTIGQVEDGKPIPPDAELMELERIEGTAAYKVRTSTTKGPAKVTSNAYRQGYDAIFGNKPTVGLA